MIEISRGSKNEALAAELQNLRRRCGNNEVCQDLTSCDSAAFQSSLVLVIHMFKCRISAKMWQWEQKPTKSSLM